MSRRWCLALAPLLSGCSHWEFFAGGAVGLILGTAAVCLALGLVQTLRDDFRGSTPEPRPRRSFDLGAPR